MKFKGIIETDIAVFLNADEFAETNDLNGTSCTSIVQDVIINDDLTVDYKSSSYGEGIYGRGAVINVRKTDLKVIPVMGQSFRLNKKLGLVVSVADDNGILTITWQANDI